MTKVVMSLCGILVDLMSLDYFKGKIKDNCS